MAWRIPMERSRAGMARVSSSILPADSGRRRRAAEALVFYVAALISPRAASRNFRNLDRSFAMNRNKLLIAITAGLVAATTATGAFAQTSSGNSSGAMGNDAAGAATDNSAAPMTKKHKMHKQSAHAATKKTPAAETGNNSATDSGQSK
ncbi:hypothetical protein BG58_02890 [Caballeronia jiangsuensis]|nr:hypothetical protein BG58_02890 [Caballeronia jiangsuensis]